MLYNSLPPPRLGPFWIASKTSFSYNNTDDQTQLLERSPLEVAEVLCGEGHELVVEFDAC